MKHCVAFLFILLFTPAIFAQEKLSLTLEQTDSLFLKNNLFLLAQQYNIEEQEALIIQAKAYPNPIFSADINAIDPQHDQYFHAGQTGQKAFGIEQLILLGGKRKTEIDIAKQNRKIATLEFDDLLRNLRLQLHSSYFDLYQQRNVLEKYNRQLLLLDTLINSYEIQARRGNLPLKDVIRLKSFYLKVNNDKSELASTHFDEQRKIQVLLQSPIYLIPALSLDRFDQYDKEVSYEDLKVLALENRPDLKIADEENSLAGLSLKLQRRMAIPDVALNSSYDQRGGAFQDQVNVGIAIPLPLWNRNRGNIKAAEAAGKFSVVQQQQKRLEVETDVQAAWQSMHLSMGEYEKVKKYYSDDFDIVFKGVNDNFQKRNISILEFVDFFESYNESLSEFERVKNHLANSATQINYVTGTKVY